MADITVEPLKVDAHRSATIVRGVLAEAAGPGDVLYPSATGWRKAQADAAGVAEGRGICVGAGVMGSSYVAGVTVDIVIAGPVTVGSGMTENGAVWVSAATAGKLDQTKPSAGTTQNWLFGYALRPDVIFVQPQTAPVTVN